MGSICLQFQMPHCGYCFAQAFDFSQRLCVVENAREKSSCPSAALSTPDFPNFWASELPMTTLPQALTSQAEADHLWSNFTARLEKVLRLANQHVIRKSMNIDPAVRRWPDEQVRAKDRIQFFKIQTPHGTMHRPTSSFQGRKLQSQVYRLAEKPSPRKTRSP